MTGSLEVESLACEGVSPARSSHRFLRPGRDAPLLGILLRKMFHSSTSSMFMATAGCAGIVRRIGEWNAPNSHLALMSPMSRLTRRIKSSPTGTFSA